MYKKKTATKYQSDVLIDYILEIFLTLISRTMIMPY